jgi:prophage maintenance system killer protein
MRMSRSTRVHAGVTALAAALVFLDWHEIEVEEPGEELYQAMIQLAERKLNKAGLAKLFERLSPK